MAAKALYIVHRFAADGSTEHAVNLKESVAILRTHHDSRRKVYRRIFYNFAAFESCACVIFSRAVRSCHAIFTSLLTLAASRRCE